MSLDSVSENITAVGETTTTFHAGSTPVWKRIGQDAAGANTSADALSVAGLDWRVKDRPIYTTINGTRQVIASHKAIVRQDTEDVLGVVGMRYRPVQNAEAFDWLDELLGQRMAAYETAGSVRKGALVWALVRLPSEMRIHGSDDVVRPYLLIVNSHDGSSALRVLTTAVRVVCSNALTFALRSAGDDALVTRHTRGVHDRLADAQEVLGVAINQQRQFELQMNALARCPLNSEEFGKYLDAVLQPESAEQGDSMEGSTAHQRIAANFDHEFQRLKGIEHTAWSAFNAVTQYVDWDRPSRGGTQVERDERRLSSTLVGQGAALKRKAWFNALELIGGN